MTDNVKLLQITRVKNDDASFVVSLSIGSIFVFPAVRVRYKRGLPIQVNFYKIAVDVGDGRKAGPVHVVIANELEFELIKLRVRRELEAYLVREGARSCVDRFRITLENTSESASCSSKRCKRHSLRSTTLASRAVRIRTSSSV